MAPGERAVAEGAGDGGERVEPFDDAGQVLQLAPREAQTLAGVVVEPGEPQALVGAPLEEGPGEAAEDAAAKRLLAGEAAKQRVEQLGAEGAIEVPAFLRGRRNEELGGDQIH